VSLRSVSVIVPVRDGEPYLGEALTSLVEQDVSPLEVIVVDDGSQDGSRDVALSFGGPVRVIEQDPTGLGAARNRGIAAARGDVIGLLDADDYWTPTALAARLPVFERPPMPDMVWGRMRQFRSPDLAPEVAATLRCPDSAQPARLPSGLLATRDAVDRVGPFRTDLTLGEFIDWMARARELRLGEAIVDDLVLWRRLHGENAGMRRRDSRGEMALVIKAMLDRRRAADSGELA
jgi:glycosyltransferase involved in cell wall biosynthesis